MRDALGSPQAGHTRAAEHLDAYGAVAVELDALRRDILEEKIARAIEPELDVGLFNAEVEKFRSETKKLDRIKTEAAKSISNMEG